MELPEKTIRLSVVVKELNVGIDHIVQFLEENGSTIEKRPSAKITEEQFELLKKHFQRDAIKIQAPQLTGPTILGKIDLPNPQASQVKKYNSLSDLGELKKQKNVPVNNSSWKSGKILNFTADRGFGKIECDSDGQDYFIPITNVLTPPIKVGDFVVFKLSPSKKKPGSLEGIELSLLNQLSSGVLIEIVEEELKRLETISSLDLTTAIAKNLHFIIPHLNNDFMKQGVLELVSQWALQLNNTLTTVELWHVGFCELPSRNELAKVFYKLDKKIKTQIVNSVALPEKILLINSTLRDDGNVSSYYANLSKVIRQFLNDANIFLFDIEHDGHSIKEFAFAYKNDWKNITGREEIEIALNQFSEIAKDPEILLAGHNIDKWDIKKLREKISFPDKIKSIDTLFIEILLSPKMRSFALNTKHNAKDDVEHTVNLLINQVIRLLHLNHEQFERLKTFVDIDFVTYIEVLRKNIINSNDEIFKHLEEERNNFYIKKDFGKEKAIELKNFIKNNNAKPTIIISPKEFYPLVAELNNCEFISDDDYSKIISVQKTRELPHESLAKYLLEVFHAKCIADNSIPLFSKLSGKIRELISEVASDFFTETSVYSNDSPNCFCISPGKLIDMLPQIKASSRPIILLEKDLISVTEKYPMRPPPFDYAIFQQRLNADSFWMYFTGGQSRVEIEREDLPNLQVEEPLSYYNNFWIEKSSLDTFQVWGNFNLHDVLKSELREFTLFDFSFEKDELKQSDCIYVIPRSTSGKLSITRYNPETRYRDRYWTFQTKLVKEILSGSDKPAVFIINQEKDKQNLYNYFSSTGYYVPDLKAAPIRQVQLLINHHSNKKLMLITQDDIAKIIHSEDLNNFNFIIDSFELEEKWFVSQGTGYLKDAKKSESKVKFKNDDSVTNKIETPKENEENDDDENEVSGLISSSQDIFLLLKLQKPIIDYYRWLFQSADKNAVVWLTDSRLGDFAGLDEEWKATKKYLPVWFDDDEYKTDFKELKKIFNSPVPREEIDIDVEATKESLRHIFLKENDGNIFNWRSDQDIYLNEILPAKKDILVTLPTGGGKSVLFQAPALYRGSISGRLTIVVTPLKALMEDHVNKLWELNFFASVDYINRDRKDTQYIYRRIAGGEILLLYITPERFRSKSFINALEMRLENDGGLEYAVYDEAHCVSQWGLDFRPDYLNSAKVINGLKKKTPVKFPLLLFSATVSEQIYNDFNEQIFLE